MEQIISHLDRTADDARKRKFLKEFPHIAKQTKTPSFKLKSCNTTPKETENTILI